MDVSPMEPSVLDKIFEPRRIAVIGTSRDRGFFWVRCFLEIGFSGEIFPVNPKEKEVLGLRCYPSVRDIPCEIDFSVIAIPAPKVPDVLRDSAEKGAKLATIFSSGFSETGTREGIELERKIRNIVEEYGIRVLGPNCMGVYIPSRGLSFRPDFPKESGTVGFISQSGGNAIGVVLYGESWGVRFSKVFSYGNGVDLESTELLEYLGWDPETEVVGIYVEGVRDGKKFLSVARRIAQEKPLVVWKGGVTSAGSKAAASHTGALAGSAEIWNAVLKQCNAVAVSSMDEMVDMLKVFTQVPEIRGRRISLISISGGASVVNTDLAEKGGFVVEEFPQDLQEKFRSKIQPVGVSVRNPIDLAGSFYDYEALEYIMEEIKPLIDVLVFDLQIIYPILWRRMREFDYLSTLTKLVIEGCKSYRDDDKVFVVILPMMHYEREWIDVKNKLIAEGVPVFQSTDRAINALAKAYRYYRRLEKLKGNVAR
ncbi:MAG: acetate--CoA ligase family protein [Candidatus Baldrarchaeia archaeon]